MTSEELFKVLPVLEAMKEGKAIQYRIFENRPWKDVTEAHCIDINSYEYRVKPEADYRPFHDFFGECWSEMAKHEPFGWVVEKKSRSRVAIIFDRMRMGSDGSGIGLSWEAAFNQWEFPDGTPFGIKEGGEGYWREFMDVEEVREAMSLHNPYGWVTDKALNSNDGPHDHMITDVIDSCGSLYFTIEGEEVSQFDAFKEYEFVDGTPFGVKEYPIKETKNEKI